MRVPAECGDFFRPAPQQFVLANFYTVTRCCTYATKQSQSETKRHIGVPRKIFGGILSQCGRMAVDEGRLLC